MRLIVVTALLLTVGSTVQAAYIEMTVPGEETLLEGKGYRITWTSENVESVTLFAFGSRTPLGGESRGVFKVEIAAGIPAESGSYEWDVPWVDSLGLIVRALGYDAAGRQVAWSDRRYSFRPAVLTGRTGDGIYLDLHRPVDQRLYVQRSGRLTHCYLTTSSAAYRWVAPGRHIRTPHDHAGTYEVMDKKPVHWSSLFQVEMPWAMRYHGGHFIHATSPRHYHLLGTPASSGCNRLHYEDARELYEMTPVGTKVVVIGP